MPDNQWSLVFVSADQYRAELIKGLLAEHGIECVVVSKKDSAYLFGDIELYVSVLDAFEANQLIKNVEI